MTIPPGRRALTFPDFTGDKPVVESDKQAAMMERLN
jgi:hypothetical protein